MSERLDPLFVAAPERNHAAGETLFRAGDGISAMLFLRQGRVDLVRHTGHGHRLILHRAGPGHILAEASAWSDVYHCDAIAVSPCMVAALPRKTFLARLAATPHLSGLWVRSLARAVQSARLRAEIRSLPKVADRLDVWLAEGNVLPARGHWQDIASELGVTREALYRELSRRRTANELLGQSVARNSCHHETDTPQVHKGPEAERTPHRS